MLGSKINTFEPKSGTAAATRKASGEAAAPPVAASATETKTTALISERASRPRARCRERMTHGPFRREAIPIPPSLKVNAPLTTWFQARERILRRTLERKTTLGASRNSIAGRHEYACVSAPDTVGLTWP